MHLQPYRIGGLSCSSSLFGCPCPTCPCTRVCGDLKTTVVRDSLAIGGTVEFMAPEIVAKLWEIENQIQAWPPLLPPEVTIPPPCHRNSRGFIKKQPYLCCAHAHTQTWFLFEIGFATQQHRPEVIILIGVEERQQPVKSKHYQCWYRSSRLETRLQRSWVAG